MGFSEVKRADLAQQVTDRIVAQLETVNPGDWRCPWNQRGLALPINASTGEPYGGMNTILLWLTANERGYRSNKWLTLKQLSALGGHLRPEVLARPKGQKGAVQCIRYGTYEAKAAPWQDAAGQVHHTERRPFLKSFFVFNLDETFGLDPSFYHDESGPDYGESTRQAIRDFVVKVGVNLQHGGDMACYRKMQDLVQMPFLSRFIAKSGEAEGPQHYDATLLHEIVHWSGAASRMNRDTLVSTGNKEDYAREELCAEFGAAMLCAFFNIQGELRHAEYLAGWLSLLKRDKYAVFKATRDARRSYDWLLDQAGLLDHPMREDVPGIAAE